ERAVDRELAAGAGEPAGAAGDRVPLFDGGEIRVGGWCCLSDERSGDFVAVRRGKHESPLAGAGREIDHSVERRREVAEVHGNAIAYLSDGEGNRRYELVSFSASQRSAKCQSSARLRSARDGIRCAEGWRDQTDREVARCRR